MRWRNPIKELPNEGDVIWVLLKHYKRDPHPTPLNCEIYAGEVGRDNSGVLFVDNADEIGQGWQIWTFGEENARAEHIDAWLPVEEMLVPEFLIGRSHD